MDDGIGPQMDPSALAGLEQRRQLLQQQLAQALQMPQQMHGYGTWGGIGAGLANAAGGISNAIVANRARAGLQQNAEQAAGARQALLKAFMGDDSAPDADASGAPTSVSGAPTLPPMAGPAMSTGPAMSGGPHPLPIGTPVQEPGLAQLASLGIKVPPSAAPGPAPAPMPAATPAAGGAAPPPSPLDQLAALSQRDQKAGMVMLASGDPALTTAGRTLLERSQREQQMGFEAQQAALGRENARDIANKPQFHTNPMGLGAYVFDPSTQNVRQIGNGPQAPAEDALIPFPVGSRPYQAVVDLGRNFDESMDIAHLPANYQRDVSRLQLGQNLMGIIQQAQQSGWNKQLRQVAASDLTQLVQGSSGTESEINGMAQHSIGATLQDIVSGLSGEPSGPDLQKYTKFLSEFANREHGLAYNRLGAYIDSTANSGTGQALRQVAPRYYEQAREAAIRRLAGLGEPGQGGTRPAAGLNLDGGPPPPTPQDAAAIQWAKANPTDPRAAKILQLNGVK